MGKLFLLTYFGALFAVPNVFAQDHSQHTSGATTAQASQDTKSYNADHTNHPGHDSHDPLIFHINMEELQTSLTQEDAIYKGKLHSWMGKDKTKLIVNARIENSENTSEYIEKEILYSSAFSVFWNWQIGARQDRNPYTKTEWVSVGVEGEAPYFIHSQLQLMVNEDGDAGLRLHFQQDWRINDAWKLTPETEFNFYSEDSPEFSRRSGLSDMHLSVKLSYDNNRKVMPYLALEYEKKWADEAEDHDEDSSQISAGVSFWF